MDERIQIHTISPFCTLEIHYNNINQIDLSLLFIIKLPHTKSILLKYNILVVQLMSQKAYKKLLFYICVNKITQLILTNICIYLQLYTNMYTTNKKHITSFSNNIKFPTLKIRSTYGTLISFARKKVLIGFDTFKFNNIMH